MTKYVYPKWRDRKFVEIGRKDVRDLLLTIEGRVQADRVLGTLRLIMQWQQAGDDYDTCPIVKGMTRSKPKERARSRILDDAEIRSVWQACDAVNGSFGAFVKLLLLCGQRRGKVATMRWDDLADGVWTVRKEPREKGTPGAIKLPPMAMDIISQRPRLASNPYVFAGRGRAPANAFAVGKRELDAELPPDMKPWVLHDLRRTARSLLSRAGVVPHISERVLGHALPGVEGIYDRHGYEPEIAEALGELAGLLGHIVNPPADNVVPLRAKRKGPVDPALLLFWRWFFRCELAAK